MLTKYQIYLVEKESSDVIFSSLFNSYNSAKENMLDFISDYCKKRNKLYKVVTKEEFEKLKLSNKADANLFVRMKGNEALIYYMHTISGRVYNSYSLEKYERIGINELLYALMKRLL